MSHIVPALHKKYPENQAFELDSHELMLEGDGYTCLIGTNGSGKSTFGETLAESSSEIPGEKWYYLPQHLDRFLFAENLTEQLGALLSQSVDKQRLITIVEELGFSHGEEMLDFPFMLNQFLPVLC